MANVINATSTGNGGLITTGDDSGVLNIQTNETTAMSVDASQSVDFTNNIDAPNTFGFKNRIINGGMTIAQRGVGPTTCGQQTNTYVLDRFAIYKDNSSATVTMAQSSTAPAGFSKSLLVTPTTGSAPTSAQELQLRQSIEGYNVADFGWGTADAVDIVVSFRVRSSVTGTFAIAIQSYGSTSTYVTTYTINSANTWETKSVTFPKITTGTWAADNGATINLIWDLGGGSNYNATANTWTSGNYYTVAGTTKLVSTTNATFYLTGVQLEKGTQATSFDFRSYGTELALCQRYYYVSAPDNTNGGAQFVGNPISTALTIAAGQGRFPVTMRTTPTVSLPNGCGQSGLVADSTSTASLIGTDGFARVTISSGSWSNSYTPVQGRFTASAEL